jgi:drug/metabolite transporter (DMT)-like permease
MRLSLIKWSGTVLCLLGILLTSFNIYPTNIFLGLIGSFLWTYAGVMQRDTPLMLVEGVAVLFYLFGVIAWTTKYLV